MKEKNLRIIEILALSISIIVTVAVMLRASAWSIDAGAFIFMLWAISPYVCFFFAGVLLRKLTPMPKMAIVSCIISVLMLAFTLLTYLGTLNDSSSTYALIFLFVPVYLFIGSFILLGGSLIFGLLLKRFQR